jgi:two-component system CheB/CheR fusion protein
MEPQIGRSFCASRNHNDGQDVVVACERGPSTVRTTEDQPIKHQDIRELLNLMIEQALEHAFFLVSPDPPGTIMWCNKGAERVFASPPGSLDNQPFPEIFTERDKGAGIPLLEMEIARSTGVSQDDRWHVRADGSTFWSSGVLLKVLHPHTGELLAFAKIIRDRTDFKTQLDLLANTNNQLQSADRDKDRAITSLSHELRNVIAGMRGTVEILDRPSEDEAVRTKFASLMQRQLGMVERLVEDLLDVKRAGQGGIALKLEQLVLQEEIRSSTERFEHRLTQRRISLEVLAPSADIVINADRVRLQQILGNLLDNAIKYTPDEGKIWIKVTSEDTSAVVHVADNGRGIPHDMLRAIFELFTQVDTHASSGGLGVGLALVRELVMLHGGSVQAASNGLGAGSEFTVRLPLVAVANSNG